VCFNPHPKTLTMAGDYEYFAAQGHHPLAFALAELVDNALRATKGNTCVLWRAGARALGMQQLSLMLTSVLPCSSSSAPLPCMQQPTPHACNNPPPTHATTPHPHAQRRSRPRSIVISLVVDDAASRGLVAVRDNGVGMTPQELNNWAVMNLSMEDRGLLEGDAQQRRQQPAGGRYLSGDIRWVWAGVLACVCAHAAVQLGSQLGSSRGAGEVCSGGPFSW